MWINLEKLKDIYKIHLYKRNFTSIGRKNQVSVFKNLKNLKNRSVKQHKQLVFIFDKIIQCIAI